MESQSWILIPFGLVFAVIGVMNLITGRLHPERPNAFLSRGLGYVGIVVGTLTFVFGLLMATGVLVPPSPPRPPAAGAPAPAPAPAPNPNPTPAPAP